MNIGQLISQASHELGLWNATEEKQPDSAHVIVRFSRKDGTIAVVHIPARADYKQVHALLKANLKSEAKSNDAKAKRIQDLEQELALLKSGEV